MGKTLAELIADAAASDDLEFAAPDGTKFKLSDVRGFRSGVETERQAAARATKEAETTAKQAKDIFDALKAAQDEMNKNTRQSDKTDNKADAWKKNPLYEDIVPVFEQLQTMAQEAVNTSKTLKQSLDQSQAIYALERMRRQWAESKVKPANKKFEEVVAEVIAAKELDEVGLPTLEKYLYRTSEPDRIKVAVDEGIAKAQKEWEAKQRASNVPKPGKFETLKSEKPPIAKLDELTSAVVSQDPDILAAMEGNTH
jgi:hypothetical protein